MTKENLDRIAVALDTSDRVEFSNWCRFFGPRVGVLKVGLESFHRFGESGVEEARQHATRLFLDLKLHDIPNTVAQAVAAVRSLGADFLTIHAGGGPSMLGAAVEAAGEMKILAVTVLTSIDAAELEALGLPRQSSVMVERWAEMARQSGCAGVVCSPRELVSLRARLAEPFLLVTPGIRPAGADSDDQRRVATPSAALSAGSDLLVIGRPLTRSRDPEAALDRLAAEIEADRETRNGPN